MKLLRRNFLHLAAGAAALPAVSRLAWAQAYPTRPMTMIVPFAAGGPQDVLGRLMAQRMSDFSASRSSLRIRRCWRHQRLQARRRVAYTRANQAKMQFGSPGAGASSTSPASCSTTLSVPPPLTCPIAAERSPCRTSSAAASTTSAIRS